MGRRLSINRQFANFGGILLSGTPGFDKGIDQTNSHTMNNRFKIWLKRVGWLGFLFFLIKGLLWLIIPYLIAKGVFSK
ncbi:hypothetical protein [Larkinella humicola]|uniref:Uncharacterized protein n=2 Tax=Larkinella TaxID=332157 RepID=A0A5N1JG53_9BACT|nr:hypothetical protein [Larkinella humicola]KAA9353799.1 hypothetical protein F0P93_14320 [Larkinella humicola]